MSILTVPPPTILVGITPDSLHLTRTDRHTLCDSMGFNLAELGKEGYMGACHKLGNITMNFLNNAHPAIFERYPALVPPTTASDLAALALALIKLSMAENTRDYVGAIDTLCKHHAEELKGTHVAETWERVRQRLMQILNKIPNPPQG